MAEPHEVLTLEELNEEEAAESIEVGADEPTEAPDPEDEDDAVGVELADDDEMELIATETEGREGGEDGV
ncbi:hypothetical protein G5C51_09605 [Streptomyces sp. A7024]|uniref:Uncharacterized protein n=1 Tax=Streptomyces coryli TaxID=1128680 RepID=A0A6G4TYG2_9ACTN|nr:hypothetical protein [Streptomyces coryli]NGN64158.1 hypothetical protein [Streptomyces coryli]